MLAEIFVIFRQEVRLKGTTLFFSTCSAYLDPKSFRKVTLLFHQLMVSLCYFPLALTVAPFLGQVGKGKVRPDM